MGRLAYLRLFVLLCGVACVVADPTKNNEILKKLSGKNLNFFETSDLIEQLQGDDYEPIKRLNHISDDKTNCKQSLRELIQTGEIPVQLRGVLEHAHRIAARHANVCRMHYIAAILHIKEFVSIESEQILRKVSSVPRLKDTNRNMIEAMSTADIKEIVREYLLRPETVSLSALARENELGRLKISCAVLGVAGADEAENLFDLDYKTNLGSDNIERWSLVIRLCGKIATVYPVSGPPQV